METLRSPKCFETDELATQSYGELFLPVRRREFSFNDLLFSNILLRRFDLVYDLKQEAVRPLRRAEWAVGDGDREGTPPYGDQPTDPAGQRPSRTVPALRRSASNRVKKLIFLMETQAAVELPSEEEALDQDFSQIPEACEGAKLTGEEFYAGHVRFCRVRRWPLCSKAIFDPRAAEQFGDTGHCYGANGTQRRPDRLAA